MDKFNEAFDSIMERKLLNVKDLKEVLNKIRQSNKEHTGVTLSAEEVQALTMGLAKTNL